MNKKIILSILPLLAISLVAGAILSYYALFLTTINVTQPVSIVGELKQTIDCDAGEKCMGSAITINNDAESERTVTISTEDEEGIEVTYVGVLDLTTKDTTIWAATEDGSATVTYSIVGEDFDYEVEDMPRGYVLIYAQDHGDRFNNPAEFVLADNVEGNLPDPDDWNVDAEPNYCNNNNGFDSYEHCYGAKLWAVPESNLGTEGTITWANMNNYLYETDLIYYFDNSDGEVTIPAGSFITFYPVYELDTALEEGEYTLETTIA